MILTVPPATHAGQQAMRLAESLPLIAAKLRALVRVDHDVLLGLASPHGHQEGIPHNLLGQGSLQSPPDDSTG